jgi:hypothetical protein
VGLRDVLAKLEARFRAVRPTRIELPPIHLGVMRKREPRLTRAERRQWEKLAAQGIVLRPIVLPLPLLRDDGGLENG